MKYKNISNEKIRVDSKDGLEVVGPGDSFEADEEVNNFKLKIINEKVNTKLSNKKVKEEE